MALVEEISREPSIACIRWLLVTLRPISSEKERVWQGEIHKVQCEEEKRETESLKRSLILSGSREW